MDKIITGSGKSLQAEVNRWLKKGWRIAELKPSKQIVFDNDSVENPKTIQEDIENGRPIKLKLKGASVQNSVMFYDVVIVILSKN